MEIDTGDSPPITPKPYMLPLKHAAWITERMRNIKKIRGDRSVSPWASLIVVVPKRSATGETLKGGYV